MSRASEEAMGDLHGMLAKDLTERIKDGEVEVVFTEDDDGEVIENKVRKPCTPAVLNVARQFLKDNHIEAQADSKAMKDLVDSLPFDDDDDPKTVQVN